MDSRKYFYPLPIPLPEDAVTVDIPAWQQAADAAHSDRATPLDIFIAHHEPAGMDGLQFHNELQTLLDYVFYCGMMSK